MRRRACKFSSAHLRPDATDRGKLGSRWRRCRGANVDGKGNDGFDADARNMCLIEAGIIDPTKVVRIALENAVSVASVLLLTEATMTEIPEDTKNRTVSRK